MRWINYDRFFAKAVPKNQAILTGLTWTQLLKSEWVYISDQIIKNALSEHEVNFESFTSRWNFFSFFQTDQKWNLVMSTCVVLVCILSAHALDTCIATFLHTCTCVSFPNRTAGYSGLDLRRWDTWCFDWSFTCQTVDVKSSFRTIWIRVEQSLRANVAVVSQAWWREATAISHLCCLKWNEVSSFVK